MKKLLKLIVFMGIVIFIPIKTYSQMNGFAFFMAYCDDASGSNPKDCFMVCPGGTLFIKNLSTFNHSCFNNDPPSNSLPLIGTITVYVAGGATLVSNYPVTNAPGGSWNFNEVLSVPVNNSIVSGAANFSLCTSNMATVYCKYTPNGDALPFFCVGDDFDWLRHHGYGKTMQSSISAGPNVSICEGESITLTASIPDITWSGPNGEICNNCQSITVSPSSTTTYTASILNAFGCTTEDNVVVTVNQNPIVNLGQDQLICNQSTYLLDAGTGGVDYEWSQPGSCIHLENIMLACETGSYCVTVTSDDGCTSSDCINLTFSQIPDINIICSDPTVTCGDPVTMTASGCSNCTYVWTPGSFNTEGISINPTSSGSYSVTATNPDGCQNSETQSIVVAPISISILTSNSIIYCGESSILTASGCNNCNFLWSNGETTSSITVSPVSTTTYTVTATNEFGCTASASQTITVNEGCFDGAYCMQIIKENNNDIGYAIERTTDGGYVIVGSMYSNDGLSNKDVYVVKFSSTMVQEFAYRLGGEYGDEGISILPRSDGYFIAGTIKISPTESDIFILKLNTDGTLSWSNRYGNNNGSLESACKIITASNNGLMVIGSSNSGGNYNVLALKLNTNGTIASKKIFSTASLTSNEIAYDAIKVGSGAQAFYIITGEQYTSVADKNMFALKIKEDYTIADNRIIANSGKSEIGYSITSTPTSIFIAGTINSPVNGYNDVYLVGLNLNNFSLLPVGRVYSIGSNVDIARQVKRMANGDLVIAGTTSVLNNINGFIMRISPSDLSTVIWSKSTNEENRNERFMDFVEGPSNFITITGSWWEETGEDIFVSKISSTGNGCCMINKAITSSPLINSISGFISKDIGLHFIPYGTSTSYYNAEVICSKPILGQRVADNIAENKIKVFPNPASDKLTIQMENTTEFLNEITISDISGRTVLSSSSKNTIEVLDVSKLLNGVYIVNVRTEHKISNTVITISK